MFPWEVLIIICSILPFCYIGSASCEDGSIRQYSSHVSLDARKNPNKPPYDPHKQLEDHCSEDLKAFCDKLSQGWDLYCLYEHKSQLSEGCQAYLGSTTLGGCNQEALNLCGDFYEINDITNCLRNNTNKLGTDCLKNIENNDASSNRMKEMRESLLKATRGVTILSAIFLLFPISLAIWCVYKMWKLHNLQDQILKEGIGAWTMESEVIQLVRACDYPLDSESGVPLRVDWRLSFHMLNYWAIEKKHWTKPFELRKKKILNNVRPL